MVPHIASTARRDKLRKACVILLNATSIGLRSGKYNGRYTSDALRALSLFAFLLLPTLACHGGEVLVNSGGHSL